MEINLKTKKRIAKEFIFLTVSFIMSLSFSVFIIAIIESQSKIRYYDQGFILTSLLLLSIIYIVRTFVWSIKTLRKKDEKKNETQ